MKKLFYLAALFMAVAATSCSDNTGTLGVGILPDADQALAGRCTEFGVVTRSVPSPEVPARSGMGYIGKLSSKAFGTYDAGFLTELNCPEGMTFPEVYRELPSPQGNVKAEGRMVADDSDKEIVLIKDEGGAVIGNVYSVEFHLWYNGYSGDSLAAARMNLYALNKQLEASEKLSSKINPEDYYTRQNLLVSKTYTPVDLTVSQTERHSSTYVPGVHLSLSKEKSAEVGGKILRQARKYGARFNNGAFRQVFKGIYAKSDFGEGALLHVDLVQMDVISKCFATDSVSGLRLKKRDGSGKDSVYYTYRSFVSTPEIVQVNTLKDDKQAIDQRLKEDQWTYLKTPSGLLTEAVLPITEIAAKLKNDSINSVRITFAQYDEAVDKVEGMEVPSTLLLVRKSEFANFFRKGMLPDKVSSFLATRTALTNQYVFGNMASLFDRCLQEREAAKAQAGASWDEAAWIKAHPDWDKVLLVPVTATYKTNNTGYYGGSTEPALTEVLYDFRPSYVRLKGGARGVTDASYRVKMEVISTAMSQGK